MYTNGHEEDFDFRYMELIMNQDGFIVTFSKGGAPENFS